MGKDYEIHVGIPSEIPDPVGRATHEIPDSECTNSLIVSSGNEAYDWLIQLLLARGPNRSLPRSMPESGENTSVEVQRRGDGAYVKFTAEDNVAEDMEGMTTIVKTECADGYASVGMPGTHTMRMLVQEFYTLTPDWQLLRSPCYRRDFRARVIHETLSAWTQEGDYSNNDQILFVPARIQEESARGREINLRADQLRVLDY
jgi:hypothetical protein